jgi:hypothetical protein
MRSMARDTTKEERRDDQRTVEMSIKEGSLDVLHRNY